MRTTTVQQPAKDPFRSDADSDALSALLRIALTAVNQQFTHILALSSWGNSLLAERIRQVDNIDYPTAIRIINHLIVRGVVPSPGPDWFVPGTSSIEILLAEQAVEKRYATALRNIKSDDLVVKSVTTAAAAPRADYVRFLSERIGVMKGSSRPAGSSPVDILFSQLMTWIEQTTIHAFVHWHSGDRVMADAAWTSSGAAMMLGADLTRALASIGTTPAPGEIAAPRTTGNPVEAFEHDRQRARECTQQAREAAEGTKHEQIISVCRQISDFTAAIAAWEKSVPHPGLEINPKSLTSIEAPLRAHVWSWQSAR